jgi:hypothetical protein
VTVVILRAKFPATIWLNRKSVVDFAQLTKKRVDIVSLAIISPSGDPTLTDKVQPHRRSELWSDERRRIFRRSF